MTIEQKLVLNTINRSVNLVELKEIIVTALRQKSILVDSLHFTEQDGLIVISLNIFILTKHYIQLEETLKFLQRFSSSKKYSKGNRNRGRGKSFKSHKLVSKNLKKKLIAKVLTKKHGSLINYFRAMARTKFKKYLKVAKKKRVRFFSPEYINNAKQFHIELFLSNILKAVTSKAGFAPKIFLFNIVSSNTIFDYSTQIRRSSKLRDRLFKYVKVHTVYFSRLFRKSHRDYIKDIEIISWLLAHKKVSPNLFLQVIAEFFLSLYQGKHNIFFKYIYDFFKAIIKTYGSLVTGFHLTISGKLSGKSIASERTVVVGIRQSKPITSRAIFSDLNDIGTFGFKLVVTYSNIPILSTKFHLSTTKIQNLKAKYQAKCKALLKLKAKLKLKKKAKYLEFNQRLKRLNVKTGRIKNLVSNFYLSNNFKVNNSFTPLPTITRLEVLGNKKKEYKIINTTKNIIFKDNLKSIHTKKLLTACLTKYLPKNIHPSSVLVRLPKQKHLADKKIKHYVSAFKKSNKVFTRRIYHDTLRHILPGFKNQVYARYFYPKKSRTKACYFISRKFFKKFISKKKNGIYT